VEAAPKAEKTQAKPVKEARQRVDGKGIPLLFIALGLLGLGIVGLIAFLVVRNLKGSPNRAIAAAGRGAPRERPPGRESPYTDTDKPQKVAYGAPLMLKLFVADQNTSIGKRNTHLAKPGVSFTVGGGNSDFLIFLVPLPARIGELKYEISTCTFYPRKSQYFPDIGGNPVTDCIGKTIRIVSDKGYELFMRIEQYEDPLTQLNRIMRSVKVPSPE
jgi:hypothetical protein